MKNRLGIVSLGGRRVGTIQEIGHGPATRFTYDAQWLAHPGARPLSVTMPLRPEPYEAGALHPFFANLLPEGWLLEVSTKRLKIARDDAFGLLLATCGDCIGAVEIADADATTRATESKS